MIVNNQKKVSMQNVEDIDYQCRKKVTQKYLFHLQSSRDIIRPIPGVLYITETISNHSNAN